MTLSRAQQREPSSPRPSGRYTAAAMCPRIVYSPRYDIGLLGIERLHPFDAHKYSRAYAWLRRRFGGRLRAWTLEPDRQISDGELSLVHEATYLAKRLRSASYLGGALEMPLLRRLPARLIDWAVLRPMRRGDLRAVGVNTK